MKKYKIELINPFETETIEADSYSWIGESIMFYQFNPDKFSNKPIGSYNATMVKSVKEQPSKEPI